MRVLVTFTLCLALTLPQLSIASSSRHTHIDTAVSALVAQFTDGIAVGYPEFRHVLLGRVFSSTSEDGVVFFNIEGFGGGNNHAEYLAFFAAVSSDPVAGVESRPFRLVAVTQIGGRGWRTFDWRTAVIKPGAVTVAGKRWRASDAMCCASEPVTVTFRVVNGSISEAK